MASSTGLPPSFSSGSQSSSFYILQTSLWGSVLAFLPETCASYLGGLNKIVNIKGLEHMIICFGGREQSCIFLENLSVLGKAVLRM